MKVYLGKQAVSVGQKSLLGQGGEACVYGFRDLALKIYHPGLATPARLAKLADFPRDLPATVLGPTELVTDDSGATVGFAMPLVRGAEELGRLSERRFRQGVLDQNAVLDLFVSLHRLLCELHQKQVVVGDLNDGNVIFRREASGRYEIYLIDADSIQFGQHRALVAHERFLDPNLYGVDLAESGAVGFSPLTDWYAFAVLLFSSLLYVHPYGGVHPAYPTLLRRAEAKVSALRADVVLPKVAQDPKVLSDALWRFFAGMFEQGLRDVVPERLLTTPWQHCACGIEHARPSCPVCAAHAGKATAATVVQGCQATVVFAGPGRVLAAAMQGRLQYLFARDGVLYREDHKPVATLPKTAGVRFGLCGEATWIGQGEELCEITRGQITHRQRVSATGQECAFAVNPLGCYAQDDTWLVEAKSGKRLANLLPGQTWFRAGASLGYGFYRVGLLTVHFLWKPGRPGIRQITLPPLRGRLLGAAAAFDAMPGASQVLVALATELDGVATTALYLVRSDGTLVASLAGSPLASPLLAHVQSFALYGGQVLVATDGGLQRLDWSPSAPELCPGRRFGATEPYVAAGDELIAAADGSVYVIKIDRITQLCLQSA